MESGFEFKSYGILIIVVRQGGILLYKKEPEKIRINL